MDHPLTRGLDLDDAQTTHLRRRIIKEKQFLRRLYEEWYSGLAAAIPKGLGQTVEIGSGPGFLGQIIPDLITLDLRPGPGIMVAADAQCLPFNKASLKGILAVNVLHHIPEPELFFMEVVRVVKPGGIIAMIEPWVTDFSCLLYSRLHHEPFDPKAATWKTSARGPLSGGNMALPWIIFERDRDRFETRFPELRICRLDLDMPLAYLLSGGVSLRPLIPGISYRLIRGLERKLKTRMNRLAMFCYIKLVRIEDR